MPPQHASHDVVECVSLRWRRWCDVGWHVDERMRKALGRQHHEGLGGVEGHACRGPERHHSLAPLVSHKVAAVLAGKAERTCTVSLPGGDLLIEWRESDNRIYMTGPAEPVFSGEYRLNQ